MLPSRWRPARVADQIAGGIPRTIRLEAPVIAVAGIWTLCNAPKARVRSLVTHPAAKRHEKCG